LSGGKTSRAQIGDAGGVLELFRLVRTALLAWARSRQDLVLENPAPAPPGRRLESANSQPTTRSASHPDKLLRVLARRVCSRRREHLTFVTPDTVVGWHRQGWRSDLPVRE
jgi:hypothetical protein